MLKNKKKNRTKGKKKGYKLQSTTGYECVIAPRFTGVAPTTYVTLKYYEFVSFSMATTVGSQQLFNLNSLFDPNRTGTGHQPYYYDNLALMYNRYRVLRAKWRITVSASLGVLAAVVPMNGTTTSVSNQTTFEAVAEMPWAKNTIIPASGGPIYTFKGSIDMNVLNGVPKQEFLDDDRFEAQIGASPAELIVLLIAMYNPNGATATAYAGCELIFEANMHDQLPVSQSLNKLKAELNLEKRRVQEFIHLLAATNSLDFNCPEGSLIKDLLREKPCSNGLENFGKCSNSMKERESDTLGCDKVRSVLNTCSSSDIEPMEVEKDYVSVSRTTLEQLGRLLRSSSCPPSQSK